MRAGLSLPGRRAGRCGRRCRAAHEGARLR
ncbi:hypothetical protein BSU04_47000 [Caballeronia sordidicola]|uniref:Uncharacterized protein n=1 Tax=Caballeronia sordidicola TaxID=196367 RepID=A0A226WLS4_CABSO|nr:hypothetical protein BSU04_47000 [Caballeronia sordidicola]